MGNTETVERVDRIVCCKRGEVYSKTIALLRNGERVEFVDSEHLDWVNLRAGDTIEYSREYHFETPKVRAVRYTLDA